MLEAAWLIPAFPLAGFVVLLLVGRRLGEPVSGWIATLAMGGSFVSTVVVFAGLVAKDEPERFFLQKIFTWVPSGSFSVDVGFFVDPLAITMCLFITGVGALIHLYSIGYMHGDPHYSKFFLYLNLFATAMLVLVLGDNLLMTFLGWEGVGACSYFLISFWFTNPANASAGKKAFVTNRVGDFGFMLATFLTFTAIGSIRYADIITEADTLTRNTATAIVLLFLLAAAGKSAQLPLYVWLPDAMAGPTPVSALIHAATMVTSGVYLLTRLNPVLAMSADWSRDVIAWVGVLTALFAATAALAQNDIKKVLAYSTVSQLGYLFLAVGVGAYVPAIFHMVTHAFFKALLFLGSGSVIHGLNDEQDMRRMGGVARWMPVTAITFIIGWLAIAGVPPFSGFWSKDEILLFAWEANPLLWAVGLLTAVLTAFYMTRQVILTFFGRSRFFDPHTEEIEAAFQARVAAADAVVAEAEATVTAAHAAVEKAHTDLDKRTTAAADAGDKLAAARTAVAESEEGADGYEKLVKAADKAEKAVPKAGEALLKAEAAVTAANTAVDEASAEVAASKGRATAVLSERRNLPSAPTHVTALTTAPDLGDLESELGESYQLRQEYHPHESPWTMTVPLVALAGLAAVAGGLNLPFTKGLHFLQHWLEPSLYANELTITQSAGMKWALAIIAVVAGGAAIAVAFGVYLKGRRDPADIEKPVLANAWYVDQTYAKVAGGPGHKGFDLAALFDRNIVDGAVNGVATVVRQIGTTLRTLQNGYVRSSALGIVGGSVVLVLWFLSRLWTS